MTENNQASDSPESQDTLSAYLRHIRNAEASLSPRTLPVAAELETTKRADDVAYPAEEPQTVTSAPEETSTSLGEDELSPASPLPEAEPSDGLESVEPPTVPAEAVVPQEVALLAVTPTEPVEPDEPTSTAQITSEAPSKLSDVATPVESYATPRPARRSWTLRDPGESAARATEAYPDLESWLANNELHPDMLVMYRAYPMANKEVPERLINALLQAAYSLGSGYPFVITLPGANNHVLLGYGGGDSSPYGVLDLLPSLYSAYRDMRQAFIHYQHVFPVKVSLESGEVVEGLGEIMMAKLKTLLMATKLKAQEGEPDIEIAELLAGAIDAVLREVFSGLAPRDEIGRVLQDPARMVDARKAWLKLGVEFKTA